MRRAFLIVVLFTVVGCREKEPPVKVGGSPFDSMPKPELDKNGMPKQVKLAGAPEGNNPIGTAGGMTLPGKPGSGPMLPKK